MINKDIANRAKLLLDKIQERFPNLYYDFPKTIDIKQDDIKQDDIKQDDVKQDDVKQDIEVQPCNSETIESSSFRSSSEEFKQQYAKECPKKLHVKYDESQEKCMLDDIAIVQGFFGTDIDRIAATTRALQQMLKMTTKPKEWLFVEAQRSKNDALFGWLKKYGIKYIFKKYDERSEGLFLKTALWNIGAAHSSSSRLCFIDSDIVFCNGNWLNSVNQAFDEYDVLSLAGYVYYENNCMKTEIGESVGHVIMDSNETKFTGHIGFSIGMTRKAYEKYGKFEAFNLHDDVWIWQKILGTDIKPDNLGWSPYNTKDCANMRFGLPLKIGSTDEVCCHLDHGTSLMEKYKIFGNLSYKGTSKPFEDMTYDAENAEILPIWAETKVGRTMKLAFQKARDLKKDDCNDALEDVAERILTEAKKEICGEIDDEHPLVIFTGFVSDFKHKDFESVVAHKDMLERWCQQPFTYVCFTNEISTEEASERGIDVIPFSSEKVKNDRKLWPKEIMRKDVKLPNNATTLFADISETFEKEFDVTR